MSAINLRAHCRIVVTSNDVDTAHVRHDFHGIVETKWSYQFDIGWRGRGLACETSVATGRMKFRTLTVEGSVC